MERPWLAVLVALLAVTAGCGTGGGSDGTTTADLGGTQTTTAAPTTGTPAPDFPFPNGTSADGITDPNALGDVHQRYLANRSYRISVTRTFDLGGERQHQNFTVTSDPATKRTAFAGDLGGPGRTAAFINRSAVFSRYTVDGDTTYRYNTTSAPFAVRHRSQTGRQFALRVLSAGVYRVQRVGDGSVRFELDEPTGISERVNLSSADGTVVVDETGYIRTATLSLTGTLDGDQVRILVDYRVDRLGDATVDRPDWLDTAYQAEQNRTAGNRTPTTTIAGDSTTTTGSNATSTTATEN